MFSEEFLINSGGNQPVLSKLNDSSAVKFERQSLKEKKCEDGERPSSKKSSLKKKDTERLSRIHVRRGESGNSEKSPRRGSKHDGMKENLHYEEEMEAPKVKSSKKSLDEMVSTRFRKKSKDADKSLDGKNCPGGDKAKRQSSKAKPVAAFGTTFHKAEADSQGNGKPKRRPSSAERLVKSMKSKRSKTKGIAAEENQTASEVSSGKDSSGQGRPLTRHSTTKTSLSKNKLTELAEEANKDKDKSAGLLASSTGKRARSPYQTSSGLESKKVSSKVRIEGDPKNTGGKAEEKAEVGKDLSFFEKIQQNVRAYFSPKPLEMNKFEEEKKVPEGDNPMKDERAIVSRKDGRIDRGLQEDFMKGDERSFRCNGSERKRISAKGSRTTLSGEPSKGSGSGPGGNFAFSCGSPLTISTEYHNKKSNYVKRSWKCRDKHRTASFHRSKTFEKSAVAPSPPTASVSILLEPDEQVENVAATDGVAAAPPQIQELHQEIRGQCSRGSGGSGEPLPPDCRTADSAQGLVQCKVFCSRASVFRPRPRALSAIVSPPRKPPRSSKSATDFLPGHLGTSHRILSPLDVFTHSGDTHRRELTPKGAKVENKPKQARPIRPQRQWLVYSVTERRTSEKRSVQAPRRERGAGTSGGASEKAEPEQSHRQLEVSVEDQGAQQSGRPPAAPRGRVETPTVTLKEIIALCHEIFDQNSGTEGSTADVKFSARAEEGKRERLHTADNSKTAAGQHLRKLMDEKKNFLNLRKTKNFRKAKRDNFISDSFNFFNLLNEEFLCMKSSNPRIEELRKVMAEKREPEMEEYLKLYKRVIKSSLTKPELYLMDKANFELERYTDLYYDMMKSICLEKDGNCPGKRRSHSSELSKCSNPCNSGQSDNREVLGGKPEGNCERNYLEMITPRTERAFYVSEMRKEERKFREFCGDRSRYQSDCLRPGGGAAVDARWNERRVPDGIRVDRSKHSVELLSPHTCKESADRAEGKKNGGESHGKVLLTISVCDDGLIIKQAPSAEKDSQSCVGVSQLPKSAGGQRPEVGAEDEEAEKSLRRSMSEVNVGTSGATPTEEIGRRRLEEAARADSDVTLCPRRSFEDGESPLEPSAMKFSAFQKLLSEGLKYFSIFSQSMEAEVQKRPKTSKGERAPESSAERRHEGQQRRESVEKERKKGSEERKTMRSRSGSGKDGKQKTPKERISATRSKAVDEQEERINRLLRESFSKTRMGSMTRKASPSKACKKESSKDGTRAMGNSTQREGSSPRKVPAAKQGKSKAAMGRKPESILPTRVSFLSRPAEGKPLPRAASTGDRRQGKAVVKREEEDAEEAESLTEFATPPGSYFECRFGMKDLTDLLDESQRKMLSPGGQSEGQLTCPNEEEERELQKMDLSGGDDKGQENSFQALSANSASPRTNLRLGLNNPLRMDWDRLVDLPFEKDSQTVTEVLNHFMGNLSEAWRAAVCLKSLIQLRKTDATLDPFSVVDKPKTAEKVPPPSQEKVQGEEMTKDNIIRSFKNFLRILTILFEDDPREQAVRRELLLLVKELTASCSIDVVPPVTPVTGDRTRFAEEIAEIPQEVKDMIVRQLMSSDSFASSYDPADFVLAVKIVGERLKDMLFAEEVPGQEPEKPEVEVEKVEKDEGPPKKIYYRPPKSSSRGGTEDASLPIRSNLKSLAEKISLIEPPKCMAHGAAEDRPTSKRGNLVPESSVYFDAVEEMPAASAENLRSKSRTEVHGGTSPRDVTLRPVDERYFSLSSKTFGKYRDLIYDKIISFLKSDNPSNVSYGMALLEKMMDTDTVQFTGKKEQPSGAKGEKERKWNELLDKLMEICHIIESEMREKAAQCAEVDKPAEDKGTELAMTCEYLSSYVDRMKALIEEMKSSGGGGRRQDKGSSDRIRALEESRERNMKRQLIAAPVAHDESERSFAEQKYILDSTLYLIDSIGGGLGLDKFSKNLLPSWLSEKPQKEGLPGGVEPIYGNEDFNKQESRVVLLEANKAMVKNLRRKIARRQRRIQEMIEEAAAEGVQRGASLASEKVQRKVRDLNKYYLLLEKMICDPTLVPPKWLKGVEEQEAAAANGGSRKSEGCQADDRCAEDSDFLVMCMLEDVMARMGADRVFPASVSDERVAKRSRSVLSTSLSRTVHDGKSLTLVKINFAKLNFECPAQLKAEEGQDEGDLPLRPKSA